MIDTEPTIIKLVNQDKSNWVKYKFSDLVENVVEKVIPKNSGLDNYIGLEHLDSESLKIRRFGETSSLIGDKLKIYKGDLIFAKRNAYLKRIAIAEFDAVASAHSMVLRPRPENVNVKFLPFFLLSEVFWTKAIEISVGSLSPTINWKLLAKQEFLLPPLEEQEKLAELLWAMDEVIERDNILFNNMRSFLEVEIEDQIHGIAMTGKSIDSVIKELQQRKEFVELKTLGEFMKGKGIAKSDVIDDGIPCVRYGELYTKHHRIIRGYYSFISKEIAKQGLRLKKNDVLFAGSGETITEIGKSAAFVDDFEVYAGSDTLIFRPYKMDGVYLGYLTNSQLVRQQLNKLGTGATVMHIYSSDLKGIIVPDYDLTQQIIIGEKLDLINSSIETLKSKIKSSRLLQKSLINQIF